VNCSGQTDRKSGYSEGSLNRILVIKLYAIGDYIMSLPALELLRRQRPSAEIHLLTGRTLAPLAECTAPVDQVISVDERILTDRKRLHSLLPLALRLRKQGYREVYLLHRVLPLRLLVRVTGAENRVGQGSQRQV